MLSGDELTSSHRTPVVPTPPGDRLTSVPLDPPCLPAERAVLQSASHLSPVETNPMAFFFFFKRGNHLFCLK